MFFLLKNVKSQVTVFFTYFSVPEGANKFAKVDLVIQDVHGKTSSLKHGFGTLIYIKDGVFDMLEAYCYDETWPKEIKGFDIFYQGSGERDWKALDAQLSKVWSKTNGA